MKGLTKKELTAVILTHNESIHIERCIKSVLKVTDRIFVVDSFSTDRTIDILDGFNEVQWVQREWKNYSDQFSYAMTNDPWKSKYQLRLDADEYLDEKLIRELNNLDYSIDKNYYVRRKLIFQEKWIRYGGYYPIWLLRVYVSSSSHIENQNMDEHIVSPLQSHKLSGNIIDHNLNSIDWWSLKHLKYASREVLDINLIEEEGFINKGSLFSFNQADRKRWLKVNLYYRLPVQIRVSTYFVYRYIFLCGFLDGVRGFYWHLFQGLWYRSMVEYKKQFECKN